MSQTEQLHRPPREGERYVVVWWEDKTNAVRTLVSGYDDDVVVGNWQQIGHMVRGVLIDPDRHLHDNRYALELSQAREFFGWTDV